VVKLPKFDDAAPPQKKRIGRPPIHYDPNYHPMVAKGFAIEGMIHPEISKKLGISLDTFKNWRKKYPEFFAAVKEGKEEADSKVIASLYKRCLGFTAQEQRALNVGGCLEIATVDVNVAPDPTSIVFWLCNRQRDKWHRGTRVELSGPDGGPIRIKSAKDLTDDELAEIIAKSTK
jgi:hypothetical protein